MRGGEEMTGFLRDSYLTPVEAAEESLKITTKHPETGVRLCKI